MTRPTDKAKIRAALAPIFPNACVFDVEIRKHVTDITVAADSFGVYLHFSDMPKIAAALGTEQLNFRAIAGSDVVDSYSFDGCVLFISASYAEGAK